MLVELLRAHVLHPVQGVRVMRILSTYRQAQEHLRATDTGVAAPADLGAAQLALAASASGVSAEAIAPVVTRWMEETPLRHLRSQARPELTALLAQCQAAGIGLGVLSDYPAAAKLEALGVAPWFSVVLTAQHPDVGVFKPHPRGLQLAIERLGATPGEALYVGDRPEVDAVAAAAAGVPCMIIGSRAARDWRSGDTWTPVASCAELATRLGLTLSPATPPPPGPPVPTG
jgi:putative hydrolase of the HAD superfamily